MRPDPPFMGFDFESTLGKIARVLTRQYAVQIVFSPSGPRVEPNKIILPILDAADEASRDVLVGYLDLLVARAKYSALEQLAALAPGFERKLAQIIEDSRTTRLLQHDYPGARAFLERLSSHAEQDVLLRWSDLSWHARFAWALECALWRRPQRALDIGGTLQASLGALGPALQVAQQSRSSGESVAAARQILAGLNLLGAGRVNTMMVVADGAGGHDGAAAEGPDAQDAEIIDETASGATPPPSNITPGADAAQLESIGVGAAVAGMQQLSETATNATAAVLSVRPRLSLPLSTEFDRVTDLTGQGDLQAWHALRSDARAATGALKDKLERALKADQWTHWRREQERGAIDRAALVRLATVPGYRTPFKVTRAHPGRATAVTVLLDLSGSMAGDKISLARCCAAALADALTQLDFTCEVLGYSSIEAPEMRALRDAQLAAGVDLRAYNRLLERLDLRIYKRFGSHELSGLASIECGHENPDGECLAWAAARLAEQPAQRRILMVLSDGYPATGDSNPELLRADLHLRIADIAAGGIELIGIGIQDDAVLAFYPDAAVVYELSELPSTAFEILSRRLLEHRAH